MIHSHPTAKLYDKSTGLVIETITFINRRGSALTYADNAKATWFGSLGKYEHKNKNNYKLVILYMNLEFNPQL